MSVWEWELTFRQEKKRITCTLLLRTIEHVVFVDRTAVYHPANNADISKVYKYSLGFAALQKKDWIMRRNYKALFVYLYYLLRAFCGMLLIRNFIKHWYSFGGKIIGFVKFKV